MRKALVASLAVALVLAGLLWALVRPLPCPVTRAACERIKLGMTRAEVEAILGGPPGDYRTRPPRPAFVAPPGTAVPARHPDTAETWLGDEVALGVRFDPRDGRVAAVTLGALYRGNPGLVELACWRLNKGLWERWYR